MKPLVGTGAQTGEVVKIAAPAARYFRACSSSDARRTALRPGWSQRTLETHIGKQRAEQIRRQRLDSRYR